MRPSCSIAQISVLRGSVAAAPGRAAEGGLGTGGGSDDGGGGGGGAIGAVLRGQLPDGARCRWAGAD